MRRPGDNAGHSKLTPIKKDNLQTLSEDEFLTLIATHEGHGGGIFNEKTEKKPYVQEAIKQAAQELEQIRSLFPPFTQCIHQYFATVLSPTRQRSCEKYDTQSLKEICGNNGQVEQLLISSGFRIGNGVRFYFDTCKPPLRSSSLTSGFKS
ncbi:hypothetical protein K503DRAFT_451389 [Rhizopogon vinicolor AM-OR11-026]|uniref:Uncharacterized protein n=1 Tax=Rhizopogon vinicolor AM-OR11-026 TaxID=1314800 RepID=A0A1B7NAB6_9AGAM|nr:hypothetical protein K503DRAFT_451389 [Rhizopogon vinicolor AM-OR11-026]